VSAPGDRDFRRNNRTNHQVNACGIALRLPGFRQVDLFLEFPAAIARIVLSLVPICSYLFEPHTGKSARMATITKKELIDRIADRTDTKRVQVKRVVQQFLDEIVNELGKANRLEFRDFGVFETKIRKARKAQNPKTLEPVEVPEKRTVKFKVGRLMKEKLAAISGAAIDDEASDVAEMAANSEDDEAEDEE